MVESTNRIGLGSQSIGNHPNMAPRKDKQEASETQQNLTVQAQNTKTFDEESYNTANAYQSDYNKSQIVFSKPQQVEPTKYLSEERISDIEAMMAEFETGVGAYANTIEAEFPGVFDEASKNALAARMFAGE